MTEASIQFHIEENDYFGTLATVIDLVSQDLAEEWAKSKRRNSPGSEGQPEVHVNIEAPGLEAGKAVGNDLELGEYSV